MEGCWNASLRLSEFANPGALQRAVHNNITHAAQMKMCIVVLVLQGVGNAAAAAKAAGAARMVLVSSMLVHPDNRWHPIRILLNNIRYSLMDKKFAGAQPASTRVDKRSVSVKVFTTAACQGLKMLVAPALAVLHPRRPVQPTSGCHAVIAAHYCRREPFAVQRPVLRCDTAGRSH